MRCRRNRGTGRMFLTIRERQKMMTVFGPSQRGRYDWPPIRERTANDSAAPRLSEFPTGEDGANAHIARNSSLDAAATRGSAWRQTTLECRHNAQSRRRSWRCSTRRIRPWPSIIQSHVSPRNPTERSGSNAVCVEPRKDSADERPSDGRPAYKCECAGCHLR